MKLIGIVGWKNSGKTYFAQKIIESLVKLKFNVASVKHAHHEFEIDHSGTDSFLHRKAGSNQVIISSSKRWAKITELQDSQEKNLNELIRELNNPDIVIIEGFKNDEHPKIEIINSALGTNKLMFNTIKNVFAIISDTEINEFKKKQFKRNQINEIVDYIVSYENK